MEPDEGLSADERANFFLGVAKQRDALIRTLVAALAELFARYEGRAFTTHADGSTTESRVRAALASAKAAGYEVGE